ncbi:MAG: DUF3859 domain-containing protein [Pararhodobacter sp.]
MLNALPGSAEPALRVDAQVAELTRGLICAPPPAGRREAPDTAFGWIHVPDEPIIIRREGTTVPAVLGMGFGVHFRLHGDTPRLLRYVIEHPPMPPQGLVRQSWEGLTVGEDERVFFQFDLTEELLPGAWSFSALDGPQEVFYAAFKVVTPEEAPELARLCEGGALLALSR